MNDSKDSSKESRNKKSLNLGSNRTKSKKLQKNSTNTSKDSSNREVLLRLPGGFEYKSPSKKQRVVLASIVLGLNVLLLVVVGLYFYLPGFQELIYNFGRN